MMKKIFGLLLLGVLGCSASREDLYVQPMVKTMNGYQKIGKPYPHVVLLGDTIKVIYRRKY